MRIDVRARVLWGEPIERIREAWLAKGAPATLLNAALDHAGLERRIHFRKRGLEDIGIGIACLGVGGLAAWFHYALFHGQIEIRVTAKMRSLIWAAMFGLPLIGLIFALRGVRRIISGGFDEEAASDLNEFE